MSSNEEIQPSRIKKVISKVRGKNQCKVPLQYLLLHHHLHYHCRRHQLPLHYYQVVLQRSTLHQCRSHILLHRCLRRHHHHHHMLGHHYGIMPALVLHPIIIPVTFHSPYSPNQTTGAGPSTPCAPFTQPVQAPSEASTEDEEMGLIIQPEGETFYPHREPTHRITEIIRGRFDAPYSSWKKIPVAVREMWFKEFQRSFRWMPEHHHHIRRNFDKRGSARLRDMLTVARRAGERPDWIGEEIWGDLTAIWESAEYMQKSEQNKKNRASDCDGFGPSLHSGGSISTTEHKRRMAKLLGREPTLSELHTRTHKRRSDSSWVDLKSANIHEKYNQLKESASIQSSAEGTSSQQSEVNLWTQATGGVRKGRLYGVGSHGTTLNMPSTYNMGDSIDSRLQKILEKKLEDTSANMTKLINERMQAIQVENRQMIQDLFYSSTPFNPPSRPPQAPAQHNQEEDDVDEEEDDFDN